MRHMFLIAFSSCCTCIFGCMDSESPSQSTTRLVEASCGQCQFGADGNGCDLAIRIGEDVYFVDGTGIDDHGDAHGRNGFCNAIRMADVTGTIEDGRFVASGFVLRPIESE